MAFAKDAPNDSHDDRTYQSPTDQFGQDPVAVSDFLGRVNLNSAQIREIAGLGAVDYIKFDEQGITPGALPSRGVMDDLCYGTGTTYLAGLTFGGTWGLIEGLRGHTPNFKLRINTVLNSVTRRGPYIGNSCGILAMGYNSINGIISSMRGRHDAVNNVASGALIGAIFKSTAGIKAATTASVMCAGVAGAWTALKQHFFKH
ncbi:putative mitochondrial import inner membrane translocase subunit TIM23 [Gigaspora margarita]|uniref:Putative mitochondrial import inner membrane translocase subunit TIM23 n=1 Tax=Gigaspora margarita TaxID=4874 RepID=A0A8H4B103_GIGMA|nr:putative mitochondrial import inner membrane translocase subunit TIM23 [Gigaspora margarita]